MSDILNILTLPTRLDRKQSFMEEAAKENIPYRVWEGIIDPVMPFRGISYAHKRIVRWAKKVGLPFVHIAEDDFKLTDNGAWKYYLDNMPQSFDLYLSMIYFGDIDENNRIKFGFEGLTLYTVHERFYDAFLDMKEENNLDRELGLQAWKYEYFVCPEFCAYQMDGYSDHKKEDAVYGHLLEGRNIYKAKN